MWLNTSYSKHSNHDAFYILQLLDETLLRCEEIDESSFSINVSTVIPENNDFFPKCNTLYIGTKATKKVQEKKEQYKDATIRNKFTQTVNIITYNTISIQTMPHPCTCVESGIKITE